MEAHGDNIIILCIAYLYNRHYRKFPGYLSALKSLIKQ